MSAPGIAALSGVRVLDLADESAILATRILADLGADVILVERPDGSRARHLAPFLDDEPGPERSFVHQYYNANKRSVRLDVTNAEGAERLRALVAGADVLVETFAPGRLEQLGFDDSALRAANPGLIHVSVTPFGLDGEWRDRQANDLVAGAAGGLIWVSGESGETPVQGAANPSYSMASLAAATGVLVALAARERDPAGRGAHLDISLQEATAMAVLQTANPSWREWFGVVPSRPGLSVALSCRDGGWVSFVTRPDRFAGFMAWLDEVGIAHELKPEDWPHARIGAPLKDNPVIAAVGELTRRLPRDEFIAGAFEADQICLPVTDFPEMDRHEHFTANRQFFEVENEPLGRSLGFVRSPVDAMAREIPIRRAPTLGEHDAEVLEERVPHRTARTRQAGDSPALPPERALAGIRIVDFCWVLAGPLGTRILANFGAEVIRIESSARRDPMRIQPGPDGAISSDLGGLFNDANTGKLSVALDLGSGRGRDVARELIARADVVTSNYRPGALERMGFGYDALREVKPDIIVLTMPGSHSRGVWSPRSMLGNTVMSGSGFNMLMGFPGQRPRGMGVAYPDFTSPYLLATTVMAALRERDKSGRGQHLDLSQLSGTVALLGVEWMQYRATGRQPARPANRSPNYCPHGVYPARGDDEWCALAVGGGVEWSAFCKAIGRPELAGDPRYASCAARRANEDAVDDIVRDWTSQRDRWELSDLLQRAGIAAAPVEHLADTLERDPQLRHHYQHVTQPSAPDALIPIDGEAIRFVGSEHRLVRAPMLGEHSERVLCEIAGLSREEFDRLVLDGVVT